VTLNFILVAFQTKDICIELVEPVEYAVSFQSCSYILTTHAFSLQYDILKCIKNNHQYLMNYFGTTILLVSHKLPGH